MTVDETPILVDPEVTTPVTPHRRREWGEVVILYGLSIGLALGISAALVAFTGGSWREVFSAIVEGSLTRPGRWGKTLAQSAPLLLVAVGTIVTTRSGLVNIGQEGQLLMGATAAAFVATRLGGPGPVLLVGALVAGAAAGGLWAALAALMRYWRKVPEVISTLLMVFIAFSLTGYLLSSKSLLLDRDPARANRSVTSGQVPSDVRLPTIRLFGNEFHSGVLIALATALLLAYLLGRTVWGFRVRMLGHNPRAAQRAGVDEARSGTLAMATSGALSGLAGAVMLTGGVANYRLTPGFSNNVGWEGLLVALLARASALLAIPMALLFGGLRTGSGFLASTGVERKIVDVVQALLVLALLVPPAVLYVRQRRRALAATRDRT